MSTPVITVKYEVKPDKLNEFIELIQKNSENSLAEPGCLNYEASMAGNKVFLYEKYKSEEDFKHHTTTEHFANFGNKTKDLLINKEITMYNGLK
ncbi:MAG: putative quinol monooxygenase [Gudongella sp.]|nr:putative quinol monooxygenase [Gudongella sp.]